MQDEWLPRSNRCSACNKPGDLREVRRVIARRRASGARAGQREVDTLAHVPAPSHTSTLGSGVMSWTERQISTVSESLSTWLGLLVAVLDHQVLFGSMSASTRTSADR